MFEQDYDALNWLCEKSEFPRIYAPLRTGLPRDPESKQYKACVELAEMLFDQTDVIRRLIHHHDWRNQVIGNMVVVLNRDNRFEEDYVKKLTSGHVHFPESLAAGWAFTNIGKTIPQMEAYLSDMSICQDTSRASVPYGITLSVYTALRILSSNEATVFEATPLFTVLKSSSFYPRTVDHTERNYSIYKTLSAIA